MKLIVKGDKLTIAAAHMLSRHFKCARLHGHNYEIEVEIEGELNEKNMIIDFGELKKTLGELFKKFDHHVLVPTKNKDFQIEISDKEVKILTCEGKTYRFPREDVALLPIESTTAELLAVYFHQLIKERYPSFTITVKVAETENSIAIFGEKSSD